MSPDPEAGGPSFDAGRDIRGAFATGAGSEARSIEAKNYFEINFGPKASRSRPGPIFYALPRLPNFYQVREADVDQARAKLLGSGAAVGITSAERAIGLKGMGGIGKTVLATALVLDPAVRQAFPDGIVWLTIGRGVPVLAKAAELAFALTGAATSFSNVAEAQGQLSLHTADQQLLVVLDDVWEPEAVEPFSRLGATCRLLITTRDARVLERAQASMHRLDLLEPGAARAFLAEAAGTNVVALPAEADEIIQHSGRLPLALAAVGALIRKKTYAWTHALAALQEGAAEELNTGWLPDPEQHNLAVVLKLSVDALSDEARDCLLACAVCREDVDIPEAALLRLWSARVPAERHRKQIAQELFDRSLVQRDEQLRYRIHDLYMDYLRYVAAPLSPRHCHLVNQYQHACSGSWAGCPDDGYCIQHLAWHLREADRIAELKALLFDPTWIRRKLEVVGLHPLMDDYALLAGDQEASRMAAALMLSAHVLGSNPDLLTAQLCGRLVEEDGPAIAELLKGLRRADPTAFMPIRNGYLNGPGALLRTISTVGRVETVAVLADGRRALSGSIDGTLQLWDLDSGTELRRFEGHTDWVKTVALLADGRRALSGSDDHTLRLWDLESGAELRRFEGHTKWVTTVALLADGRRALSGSYDQTLRLWDLESGAELHRFEGHTSEVKTVALLADGRRALSGSDDHTLRLWDLESGAELRRFEGHTSGVWTVALLADGRRVLSGSSDNTLRLWDLESGAELRRFEGHRHLIASVALLADGRRALSGSRDWTLRLWDLESGAELRRFEGHAHMVNTVALLADGRRALSGSEDQTLRLWDLESGAELRRFEGHTSEVKTVAVLADGRRALSSSWDRTVRLWDLETGAELRRFEDHMDGVDTVAVLADGRRALSGSYETLRLWDLESGAELHPFKGHTGWVKTVAPLADGRRALSGSGDHTLRLWDLESGAELRRFEGHTGPVTTVAVLADGRRALSGSYDQTLRLWDLESGAELRRFEGHTNWVMTVAPLADGRRALSGAAVGELRLWDLESGAELRRFEGHTSWVMMVAVLADGRRALSGSDDHTLRLWDLETGAEVACFVGDYGITSLTISLNQHRALIGDARGQVMVFPLPN